MTRDYIARGRERRAEGMVERFKVGDKNLDLMDEAWKIGLCEAHSRRRDPVVLDIWRNVLVVGCVLEEELVILLRPKRIVGHATTRINPSRLGRFP